MDELSVLNENIENLPKKMSERPIEIDVYNNEKNLMLYPFCSTSKRKRINPIYYSSEDGERWLEVTANNTYGMAKIWDFDILRFVFSKVAVIVSETGYYSSKITFTAYECLKALNRDPRAGKNVKWLREALDRLASTTYKSNVFEHDAKRILGFTLIKYEYEESENGIEKVLITLDDRLVYSIKNNKNLLKINQRLIREDAGIKKRLLELVDVSMRNAKSWEIELGHLQKLCANDWSLKRFKFELSTYYDLPWKIEFKKIADSVMVKFDEKLN